MDDLHAHVHLGGLLLQNTWSSVQSYAWRGACKLAANNVSVRRIKAFLIAAEEQGLDVLVVRRTEADRCVRT